MMPLLQRYILCEIVRTFLFVVLGLTVLLVAVGVVQHAVDNGLGGEQLLQILPYIVPSMLPFTIPAALLLTVCLVYGRMAGDHEVTAAKAAGISVMSLLWPALFTGGILSCGSLLLADQVIPWAVMNIERTIAQAVEDVFLDKLRADRQFHDRQQGIRVTVNGVEGRTLIRPIFRLEQRNSAGRLQVITLQAAEAELRLDPQAQEAIIRLRDGMIELPGQRFVRIRGEDTRHFRWNHLSAANVPRNLPLQVIRTELEQLVEEALCLEDRQLILQAMSLTLGRLDEFAQRARAPDPMLEQVHRRNDRLRTEIHSRFALSCSCLFFVFLGAPFAILRAKGHFLTTFLFCFGPITGVYYPLMLGLMGQAKQGHVDPAWAMWVANGLLCIAGVLVLRRVMKH